MDANQLTMYNLPRNITEKQKNPKKKTEEGERPPEFSEAILFVKQNDDTFKMADQHNNSDSFFNDNPENFSIVTDEREKPKESFWSRLRHSKEKNTELKCFECGKIYKRNGWYQKHSKIHEVGQPQVCIPRVTDEHTAPAHDSEDPILLEQMKRNQSETNANGARKQPPSKKPKSDKWEMIKNLKNRLCAQLMAATPEKNIKPELDAIERMIDNLIEKII